MRITEKKRKERGFGEEPVGHQYGEDNEEYIPDADYARTELLTPVNEASNNLYQAQVSINGLWYEEVKELNEQELPADNSAGVSSFMEAYITAIRYGDMRWKMVITMK